MTVNLFKLFVGCIAITVALCIPHEHHHDHKDHKDTKKNPLQKMQDEGIVPDVIDTLPTSQLAVSFGNKVVSLGNVLTPTEVKEAPTVRWDAEKDAYYTLAMVDPDAPSRKEPKFREVNHWLVGNIKGSKLSDGDVIAAFLSSGPPKDTGKHRYVFLLFKQPKELSFDHSKTAPFSREHRLNFSIKKFAEKNGLGAPVAGNFYQAEWDPYVEERNKKITS